MSYLQTEWATGDIITADKLNNIENGIADVLSRVYPVGSVYMSISPTSPATLFGGTWEQIQNTFLLAAGSSYSAGSTGGAATHTLTTAQMPSHTHTFTGSAASHTHTFTGSAASHTHGIPGIQIDTGTTAYKRYLVLQGDGNFVLYGASGSVWASGNGSQTSGSSYPIYIGSMYSGTSASTSVTPYGSNAYTSLTPSGTNASTGSGSAHNNMPPYMAVYMWQRTA